MCAATEIASPVGKSGADGIKRRDTDAALIAFKRSVGLPPNPSVDAATLEKLFGFRVADAKPIGSGEPAWLTFARRYSGLSEIKGRAHAPEILEMWRVLGLPYRDDETPWCAAFVGFVLESCGCASTRSAWARSYENWGQGIKAPAVSAVVTFKRDGGGHVGFVTGRDQRGYLMALGGNQADAVNIKPFDPARVTAYRWPPGQALPVGAVPVVASNQALSTNEA